MHNQTATKFYSPLEERINIGSHALGFVLSLVASVLLVHHAARHGGVWHVVSFSIFGASLATLYAASTSYHSARLPARRRRLRVLDHAAIYVLIAGTYTPFTLVTLPRAIGWVVFGLAWGMALVGIVLKLYFTGRYDRVSTAMYVLMGWIIVIALGPLKDNFSGEGLTWLVAGGISYTVGAVLYSIKRIRFNHAIFHTLVLAGSVCHFVAVFWYVLPRS